jgi:hypothetical protein
MAVTKDQSSRWQRLGRAPDDEFEAAIAERRVEQLIAKPQLTSEKAKGGQPYQATLDQNEG